MLIKCSAAFVAVAVSVFSVYQSAHAADVKGYFKKDGTYVAPHQRSNPDQYKFNNKNSESNGGKQKDEFSTDDYSKSDSED